MNQYKIILKSGQTVVLKEDLFNLVMGEIQRQNYKPVPGFYEFKSGKEQIIVDLTEIAFIQPAFRSGMSGLLKLKTPEQDSIDKEAKKDEQVGSLTSVIDKNKPDENAQ